uniref:Lipoprotein n=1 Tax=Rhodopseudomonas palustris (strain BisA53) TaxID=316055 RepID=Q07TC3_RHOP5
MRAAKTAALFSLLCSLGGCGTYVPSLGDWPNNSYGDSVAMINSIVHSVRCELRQAVTQVVGTDVAASRLRRSRRAYADFLDNWGAQVVFTFTIVEKSTVNPNAVWAPPSPATAVFTLAGGVTASAEATRVEKLNFFYTVRELYLRDGETCEPSGLYANSSFLIKNDLKIAELLESRMLPIVTGNASAPGSSDSNAITHQVSFEVISSGGITPTWKLTRATINGSESFLSASRGRTHDMIVTFGPIDKPRGGKSLIAIAEQSHFTTQLTAGFRAGVRSTLPR